MSRRIMDNRFTPLNMTSIYNRTTDQLSVADCSELVRSNAQHLLQNNQILWGIPFQLGPSPSNGHNVLLVKDKSIEWKLPEPRYDQQLLFVHAADFKDTPIEDDGLPTTMMGTPRLGEVVCLYKLHYADNTEVTVPIRRRYQISEFQVKWGENSFEAVKHTKPRTLLSNSDLPAGEPQQVPWGQSQLKVTFQGFDSTMHHWLYPLQNPYPEKALVKLSFCPVDGTAFIFGITGTKLTTNPFRWETRQQVRLKTLIQPNPYLPDANIELDLGEIIAVTPALQYNHKTWLTEATPQLPEPVENEWIVTYTAHPAAHLTLHDQDEQMVIPLAQLLQQRDRIACLPKLERKVTIRIIDKSTQLPTSAKLHIHGAYGTYIAPVNGHRYPNPHWFEDYGTEHVQAYHYSCYVDGTTQYRLPLGMIYIEVTKGFEVRPVRQSFHVTEQTEVIDIELEHVLPWRHQGWVTADTHVHFLSPQTALLEGAAEGVNVINLLTSQWGEMFSNLGDFDGKTTIGSKEAGGDGEYLVRVGTENRQHILGHISLIGYEGNMILPLATDQPDEAALGDALEVSLTEWARQCHKQNGIAVLPHLPNPRAEGAATIVLSEIDAVEMCSFENKGINPYSLADWYRYLNCGYMVPAVGGTDKMSQATAVGTIRTYTRMVDLAFDYERWMASIQTGNTFVTFGPLIEFHINGHAIGSTIHISDNSATVDVHWTVASVTIPITTIEIIVNGKVRAAYHVDAEQESHIGYESLSITDSSWIALRVRGKYNDQSEIIAAHTSAICIMLKGKRLFQAADAVTILEQIEGSTAYIRSLKHVSDNRIYKQLLLTLTSAYRSLHNRMHHQGIMHHHHGDDLHHLHRHD